MNTSMMQFDGVAAVFAVIAILCLLAGYKLLSTTSWIGGWLRGNMGILCVLLTGAATLCVVDLRSYKPMFDNRTIATLSFRQLSPSRYEARVVDAMGIESRYTISGDSWHLSANQFKWSKRMSLGMGHGYRFNTLVGVYEKTNGARTVDVMSRSKYFDVWNFMNSHASNTFLVSTDVVTTESQPLADAAMFEVVPSGVELAVKPLNEFAKRAQTATQVPPATVPEPEAGGSSTAVQPVSAGAVADGTNAAATLPTADTASTTLSTAPVKSN